jgi:hypothetical protein
VAAAHPARSGVAGEGSPRRKRRRTGKGPEEWILQQLIEAEATERIGAGRYERSEDRVTQRNGYRRRLLSTPAGDVQLGIPKLREEASSRASSPGVGASTGSCSPCSARPTSRESRRGRSTTWWPRTGWPRGSPRPR